MTHTRDHAVDTTTTAPGSIGPCVYPGCRDTDGNPTLTRHVICDPCRRRYRRLLDRIALDYTTIRATMPQPTPEASDTTRAPTVRSYGHPAEWASHTLATIAGTLNWIEDDLRDTLGDDPPPHPGHSEHRLVAHAHHYLTTRFDALCAHHPAAGDTATELDQLHGHIRRQLGHTRARWHLPTPCPDCDLLTLTRAIDRAGTDEITCAHCGLAIPHSHYEFYTRILVDEYIHAADTPTQPTS